MEIKDIKLGELKRYIVDENGQQMKEMLGIVVGTITTNFGNYLIFYGYTKDGVLYANKKIDIKAVREIKAVRLANDDKTREMFSKLYADYQKLQKCGEQYELEKQKLRELEMKAKKMDAALTHSVTTIMNKQGIMSISQFRAVVDELFHKKLSLPSSDSLDIQIYSNVLSIGITSHVARMHLAEAERLGIAYREYDDEVFMYDYANIKNHTMVKNWESMARRKFNLSQLKATEQISLDIGDKGHIYFVQTIIVPLSKQQLSKELAKTIVATLFKK